MDMGLRIKERRVALNMTQEDLANKLGLQKSAIAKYENGRVENIKRSVIQQMAHILRCSPSYLMGWTDELNSDTDFSFNRENIPGSDGEMKNRCSAYFDNIMALMVLDRYRASDPVTQKNVRLILGVQDPENP